MGNRAFPAAPMEAAEPFPGFSPGRKKRVGDGVIHPPHCTGKTRGHCPDIRLSTVGGPETGTAAVRGWWQKAQARVPQHGHTPEACRHGFVNTVFWNTHQNPSCSGQSLSGQPRSNSTVFPCAPPVGQQCCGNGIPFRTHPEHGLTRSRSAFLR